MSRARVNPLKKITVPRLELTAATLAVRLNATIQIYLTNMFEPTFFWTDSMSVLWCIKNESSLFKTFVSNRIALITESTEVKQWKYVPDSENPADDVSRGMSANSLLESSRWLRAPVSCLVLNQSGHRCYRVAQVFHGQCCNIRVFCYSPSSKLLLELEETDEVLCLDFGDERMSQKVGC